jgi:hypothetical protein
MFRISTSPRAGTGDGGLRTSGSAATGYGPAETIYLGVGGATTVLDLNGGGKPDILSGSVELLSQTAPATTTPVASTTAPTVSAASTTVGQQVTFTAAVSGPSRNATVPTGSVTFKNGTTTLGTGMLDGTGKATLSTSTLAVGSYSVTAVYGGNANFNSSTSSVVSLTVNAAAPADFTISLSPASATVSQAGSATSVISITPEDGFNQAVALGCAGAPTNSACSISPGSVTPSGTTAAVTTLTVKTGIAASASARMGLAFLGGGALLVFGMLRVRGLHRRLAQLCLVVGLLVLSGLAACGGSGGGSGGGKMKTPTGSYTVTVTGTAGATTHSASFSLKVQ